LGYSYSSLRLDDYPTGAQLQRVLVNRGIEGVVMLPLRIPSDFTDFLDWSRFSVVSTTPSVVSPHFHSVTPNHFDNMLLVCRSLRDEGFRRIGLALSSDFDRRVKHRWTGGLAWQNLFGGTEPVPPLITSSPGPEIEPARFAHWLRKEKPDAVIADAPNRAILSEEIGALPRKRRPKLVTMGWPDPLYDAGLDQRPEHLGSCAIDVLAGMLLRGEKGIPEIPNTTMIAGQWMSGKLG